MTFEKILIKSVSWVGDTILTTPSIRLLRRSFPDSRIVAIARPWVADLLLDNADINEVWVENESKSIGSFLHAARRIRKEQFDLGVAFPNSFIAAALLWAGGVKYRIGYNRDARGFLLSQAVKVTPDILRVHQVEYYLNILRGICDVDSAERKLVLPINPEAEKEVLSLLHEVGLDPDAGRPLIGLNPGAFYGSAKRWMPERFAAVADYVYTRYDAGVIITGTKQERFIADEVVANSKKAKSYNMAGKISLKQLIALLNMLDLYITNDSGAMHIAAAVDIPIIAIFGSTDWRTTSPYSAKATIVRKEVDCAPCLKRECPRDHKCMKLIQVEDVTREVDSMLSIERTAPGETDRA